MSNPNPEVGGQVWAESFSTRLALRPKTQHSTCSLRTRHKWIIRRVSSDRRAQQAQLKAYGDHLKLQYSDRCIYWSNRSLSRLKNLLPAGYYTVCIIMDGVDHSKFRYPRSRCLSAKEFATLARPALDVHGIIAHGYGVFLALSEPMTPKDSSWCAELLFHTLHRLSCAGVDLRGFEINCQADNTSRECKNSTLMRTAAVLCAGHKIKRFQWQFLMTGHSHEDIDQFFSILCSWIESHSEVHTPDQFLNLLNILLQDPGTRPNETEKEAFIVHRVRDWIPG